MDIDFDYLHLHKGHLLLSKWDDFKSKIIPIFQQRIIQDKQNLEILNDLVEQYRNNPKSMCVLNLYTKLCMVIFANFF